MRCTRILCRRLPRIIRIRDVYTRNARASASRRVAASICYISALCISAATHLFSAKYSPARVFTCVIVSSFVCVYIHCSKLITGLDLVENQQLINVPPYYFLSLSVKRAELFNKRENCRSAASRIKRNDFISQTAVATHPLNTTNILL